LGLQPNTQYFYRVTAWNSKGNSAFAATNATTDHLSWTQLVFTGGPPAGLGNHSAIFDSLNQRMVVFGGIDDGLTVSNTPWFFNLSAAVVSATPWSSPATTGIT